MSLRSLGTFGPKLREEGVTVETLNIAGSIPGPQALWHLHRTVRAYRPDLLQGWMYHGNLAATLAAHFSNRPTPFLWNIRQSLYDIEKEKAMTRYVIALNRRWSPRASALIYNGELSKRQHEARGFSSMQSIVIPNGFDIEALQKSGTDRRTVRTALEIPEKSLLVGHLARFHPMKNHRLFLEAAVRILEKKPDVYFLLAGKQVSLDNALLGSIIPEKVRSHFRLLGERTDVKELLSAMDLLCSSSWGESFPNVVGEAMAMELPCLVTDVGDCARVVGDCGAVVPPGDQDAFLRALGSLLSTSREKLSELGRKARERIKSDFSMDLCAKRYVTLYGQVLENRRKQVKP